MNLLRCRHAVQLRQSLSLRGYATRPIKPFGKTYDAQAVEEGWYEWWQDEGLFRPKKDSEKKPFTMVTPPPNVTGSLHIGHALTLSVEDALVRYKRMAGFNVDWVPGTDHAGIGTQSVVEKMLKRERGLTRTDLGREAFIDAVWQWREEYGDRILAQMRRMGASVNWDELFFTMDPPRAEAVQNAFMQLYKDGLIYRDTRLVNWCCALETVISDIEVDYKDIEGRTLLSVPGHDKGVEFGVLHRFAYPVVGTSDELIVSTTRIETMLGDCAVAVHPDDPRYKHLHGKFVLHPILKKEIPIVCDDQLVDMEFGTGVVKITPAHDPNDYACARRHQLPITSIFDKLGRLNASAGVPEWIGRDRFELRQQVVDRLSELGSYQGRDDKHVMRVAVCSRSGDVIEPMLQPQWYIRCAGLAETSRKQVENGLMRIEPASHVQDWYRWLDNIQDWCISRQLWWGHEIPAYQVRLKGHAEDLWVVAKDTAEAEQEARALLEQKGLPSSTPFELQKDQDVLDTWFSSGLLPLSAFGWTGKPNEPIPTRYPLQVMETGYDILFFWVARMAMLANHFTQRPPFETIYLHAMVRDAQGRKMSKSLGNVIDPLHVMDGVSLQAMQEGLRKSNLAPKEIDRSVKSMEKEYPNGIPACGADSLRFALIAYTQQSRQINLDMNNVVQTTYFCNKLWNLFKFGLGKLDKEGYRYQSGVPTPVSLVDRYLLSRMAGAVRKCEAGFEAYRLHEAADAMRRFIVEDVCDVYVEFSKAALNNPDTKNTTLHLLHHCLDVSLRLAHPFMPFVTEELYHHMNGQLARADAPPSLMVESYPTQHEFNHFHDAQVEDSFQTVLSIIHASRSLRQQQGVSIGHPLSFKIQCDDLTALDPLVPYMDEVKHFVKASDLNTLDPKATIGDGEYVVRAVSDKLRIMVPASEIVEAQLAKAAAGGADIQSVIKERLVRIDKKLSKLVRNQEKLQERIQKPGYAEAVPEAVQTKDRAKQKDLLVEIEGLENDKRILERMHSQSS